MTATCIPSTRRRLLLLSVVTVVTGIQPEAPIPSVVVTDPQPEVTAPSSASPSNQPHDDTSTLIASISKSRNEERLGSDALHTIFPSTSILLDKTQGMLRTAFPFHRTHAALTDLKLASNPVVLETAVKTLFDHYGVGAVTSKVFESKQYRQWSSSILGCWSKKSLVGHKLIFNRLLLHYDQKLPEMLALAKRDHATHHIAELYETMQIDDWIIRFRNNLDDLVGSPDFQGWYKLKKDMKQFPEVALRARLKMLQVHDWNYQLAQAHLLNTEASSILSDLVKVDPKLITFEELELQYIDDIGALLKSELFEMWKIHVGEENIGKALLSMIRGRFQSDHELLAALINLPEPVIKYREKVLDALVEEWIALKLSPQDVSHILWHNKIEKGSSLGPKFDVYNDFFSKWRSIQTKDSDLEELPTKEIH